MIPLGFAYVFLLVFLALFLGPFLIYFSLLFAVKIIDLYSRYLDWVFEKLSIRS